MITSVYIEDHEYLATEPLTLNLGGEYLYSFTKNRRRRRLRVTRKINEKYIPNLFNILSSRCSIQNLSAIVGENGIGKSSILDVVRSVFIENSYALPGNETTVLVEINGELKILQSPYNSVELEEEINDRLFITEIGRIEKEKYQSIYYSPHFDLKYSNNFDEIDRYDISLDQFLKSDLDIPDGAGTNESGWKFNLHEEILFKNSMRQIEFLNSANFRDNNIFREVFNIPEYDRGILHFRNTTIERERLWNTPTGFRPILENILDKIEKEHADWHIIRDQNSNLSKDESQVIVNRYLLERHVLKSFLSMVIDYMEKKNDWLDEGAIDESYSMDRFKENSAFEVFSHFIKESHIKISDERRSIFEADDVLSFFDLLYSIFSSIESPDHIKNQSISLSLDDLRDVMLLQKKILRNLFKYYYPLEGLIDKNNYIEGFLSFRPTDRSMSSGENALLNFFSKLYNFIDSNLREDSRFLVDKENYVLLLDEADLGFHPMWKKKYIDSILKTLPHFFDPLVVKPNLQIIISTHDPLTLSDLPSNNVVFLTRGEDGLCKIVSGSDKIQRTFGANITDLLAHSFFVNDGLIGDFSKSIINEIIDWINKSKELNQNRRSKPEFLDKLKYYKKLINLIDEKIVKFKLAEMLTDLVPDDEFYNNVIDREIEFLRKKKK